MPANYAECYAYDNSKIAEQVCTSFGGTLRVENGCDGGCKIYELP